MAHNYTIDLTGNNKSKPSGSQTPDDNLLTIASNNNKKQIKRRQDHSTQLPLKNSKSINVARKNTLIVGDSILEHFEG